MIYNFQQLVLSNLFPIWMGLCHTSRPTVLMVGKPEPRPRAPSRSQRGSALLSTKALVTALIAGFAMYAPDASHPISNCLNAI